ncbi:MAG: COX15/CtaA family protein [Bacteroidetes bacterium]|nr:COX15/CtaA family protein [Bacteroidota bacterium]
MAKITEKRWTPFQVMAVVTVMATLVLIVVGGLVRASGAGLGCPDWPKCFGVWIPPTNIADLPPGWDPALFNPTHTWLEYINRLVGVLIGIFITITMILSFWWVRRDLIVTATSVLSFVLVIFQAWLGGQVVRSQLEGGMITAHMLIAMLIVSLLLFGAFRGHRDRLRFSIPPHHRKQLLALGIVLFAVSIIQMVLGTQVRELIDAAKNAAIKPPRSQWLDVENTLYVIHRSFSWVVLLAMGALGWVHRRHSMSLPGWMGSIVLWIGIFVLSQIFIGIGLERLDMPGVLQLLHLSGISFLLTLQFIYILVLWQGTVVAGR